MPTLLGFLALVASAQTESVPGGPILEVTWSIDSRVGTDGRVQIVTQGRYQVDLTTDPISNKVGARACTGYTVDIGGLKAGQPFCFRLKYLGGRVIRAEGQYGEERVVLGPDPAPAARPATEPDGMVRSRNDGTAELVFEAQPGWVGVSGPWEEALACYDPAPPALVIGYTQVRALASLQQAWSGPAFAAELEGCAGTITVEVKGRAP